MWSLILCLTSAPAVPWPESHDLPDLTALWEADRADLLWGFRNLYNPMVVYDGPGEYPYRMWLFGWAAEDDNPGHAGADAVFTARSKDLREWEVYAGEAGWDTTMTPALWQPVLTAGDEPWDNVHNGDPSVVKHEGRYYMAFSSVGFDTRTDADGVSRIYVLSCVMGAVSDDGLEWRKSERPILLWEHEWTDGWALQDGKIGSPPEGYQGSYHRPSLLRDGGRWRIWFDYFLPGTFVSMGLAENAGDFLDPTQWEIVRAGDAPLLRDWPNAAVVREGATYYAFSDAPGYPPALGGDGRQLTIATSPDGVEWSVVGRLAPEVGGESSHVPEALVLDGPDGRWLYLFYAWKPAVEPWDYRYKAIRVMRRRLP